jgi:hypothetical protein
MISGPFFIGILVGVGCGMMVLGPGLGTLVGTHYPMPMCACQAHVGASLHFQTSRRHAASLQDGAGLQRFVEHEFRDCLRCGCLAAASPDFGAPLWTGVPRSVLVQGPRVLPAVWPPRLAGAVGVAGAGVHRERPDCHTEGVQGIAARKDCFKRSAAVRAR